MTSIQLIINQILYFIPKAVVVNTKEIFDNITDYIFYGGVINKTKKNKKQLISLINNRFLINKMIEYSYAVSEIDKVTNSVLHSQNAYINKDNKAVGVLKIYAHAIELLSKRDDANDNNITTDDVPF